MLTEQQKHDTHGDRDIVKRDLRENELQDRRYDQKNEADIKGSFYLARQRFLIKEKQDRIRRPDKSFHQVYDEKRGASLIDVMLVHVVHEVRENVHDKKNRHYAHSSITDDFVYLITPFWFPKKPNNETIDACDHPKTGIHVLGEKNICPKIIPNEFQDKNKRIVILARSTFKNKIQPVGKSGYPQ